MNRILLFLGLFSSISFSQVDTSFARVDSCFIYAANVPSDDWASMCLPSYWGVHSNCPIEDYHLIVYNRWGEIMFESNTQGEKWYTAEVNDEVYIWRLTGIDVNENKLDLMGNITVIR